MANKWVELARPIREVMNQAGGLLDDKQASTVVSLYPELRGDGALIPSSTRIRWDGKLYRAAVDLWDNAQSTPETAPALWEEIAYRDGIRIIPEVITAGTAFAKDEPGWWNDVIYQSMMDNNVWTPEQNPNAWKRYVRDA